MLLHELAFEEVLLHAVHRCCSLFGFTRLPVGITTGGVCAVWEKASSAAASSEGGGCPQDCVAWSQLSCP